VFFTRTQKKREIAMDTPYHIPCGVADRIRSFISVLSLIIRHVFHANAKKKRDCYGHSIPHPLRGCRPDQVVYKRVISHYTPCFSRERKKKERLLWTLHTTSLAGLPTGSGRL